LSRLPLLNFKTAEKLLLALGFNRTRQKGSHVFYRHPDGRTTTVPNHGHHDLARPLLREILREIELTPEEYLKILDEL